MLLLVCENGAKWFAIITKRKDAKHDMVAPYGGFVYIRESGKVREEHSRAIYWIFEQFVKFGVIPPGSLGTCFSPLIGSI